MLRTGSIRLANIFGIRIGVDTSWFVVLFFFIYVLSGAFRDALGEGRSTAAFVTAVASALLFFVSLILHELGHALMARRLGISITGIDLWFFGGVAKMSKDTDSPGDEFKVAIAGPVVTLLVIVVCVGAGIALDGVNRFWDAAALTGSGSLSPGLLLLSWLATINAGLLLFNLVPAFPLDGGRIARAIAWKRTGDRVRATRAAAGIGRGFSTVLIGAGVFVAISSGAILTGLWFVVLGMFLGQAARGAVVQTVFSERLGEVRVADIMDREPVSVPGDLPAQQAQDEFFLRYRWPSFPVVDGAGRFIGHIRQERIDEATRAGDAGVTVHSLMDRDEGDGHVDADASIEDLLASEVLRRSGALAAVDGDGILRGVVTFDALRQALHAAALPTESS